MYICEPPSSGRAHAIAEIVAMLVAGSALGSEVPDGWSFLSNVELAPRPEMLLVTDVAGWQLDRDRLAQAATPIQCPPGWVCDVLDPGCRGFTLTGKRRAYAELGVEWLWIADADAQVLEIFHNHRGQWLLVGALSDEPQATAPPFESFHFDVGELWLRIPPPRSSAGGAPVSKRRG